MEVFDWMFSLSASRDIAESLATLVYRENITTPVWFYSLTALVILIWFRISINLFKFGEVWITEPVDDGHQKYSPHGIVWFSAAMGIPALLWALVQVIHMLPVYDMINYGIHAERSFRMLIGS